MLIVDGGRGRRPIRERDEFERACECQQLSWLSSFIRIVRDTYVYISGRHFSPRWNNAGRDDLFRLFFRFVGLTWNNVFSAFDAASSAPLAAICHSGYLSLSLSLSVSLSVSLCAGEEARHPFVAQTDRKKRTRLSVCPARERSRLERKKEKWGDKGRGGKKKGALDPSTRRKAKVPRRTIFRAMMSI